MVRSPAERISSILGCSAAQVSENHLEIPNDQRQVALGWEIVTLADDADRDVYLSQVKIPWLC